MKWSPNFVIKPHTTLTVEVSTNSSKDTFVYTVNVPNHLSKDMYELIAKGVLFENDWTRDNIVWKWREIGHS